MVLMVLSNADEEKNTQDLPKSFVGQDQLDQMDRGACSHASWKALLKHIWPERNADEIEMFAANTSLEEFVPLESEVSAEDRAAKIVQFRTMLEDRLAKSADMADERS